VSDEVAKRNDSLRKDNKPEQGIQEARYFGHNEAERDKGLLFPDGHLTRGEIEKLDKLKWSSSGTLELNSCNTGVSLDGAKPIAQTFANSQEVKTRGEMGKSVFSEKEDKYTRIDTKGEGTSTEVYLHAYEHGQNAPLYGLLSESGKRIPAKDFLPEKKAIGKSSGGEPE